MGRCTETLSSIDVDRWEFFNQLVGFFYCQTPPGLLICLRVFLSLFIDLLVPELFVYACIYLSLTYTFAAHELRWRQSMEPCLNWKQKSLQHGLHSKSLLSFVHVCFHSKLQPWRRDVWMNLLMLSLAAQSPRLVKDSFLEDRQHPGNTGTDNQSSKCVGAENWPVLGIREWRVPLVK